VLDIDKGKAKLVFAPTIKEEPNSEGEGVQLDFSINL
jgi:hypothetical protein